MNNTPLENDECYALVDYLNVLVSQGKVLCYTHIPNSTFTKSWPVKTRNKKLGVHAGPPDYLIVMPTRTVFIEMKRVKGSTVSEDQEQWIEALNNGASEAYICYGFDEAKNLLDGIILTEQSK